MNSILWQFVNMYRCVADCSLMGNLVQYQAGTGEVEYWKENGVKVYQVKCKVDFPLDTYC